jgi:hypothetical protein
VSGGSPGTPARSSGSRWRGKRSPPQTAEEIATEIYKTVLAEMIAEDPAIRKAIEDDPELAGELYAYALEKAR